MRLTEQCRQFSAELLNWSNPSPGRGLPWAFESDPYRIWVSEIMLQQTQANTVIPYYLNFIDRFPNITQLSNGSLDEVLSMWAGLGYYTRARNLHRAAKMIRERHNGEFPQDFTAVQALPGVGRSTAGAICALAYGWQTPILDGNAKRVYARYFCVNEEKESTRVRRLWKIAEGCSPAGKMQLYTQLIMDLGATICTPKSPQCETCPVATLCCARKSNQVDNFPLKKIPTNRKNRSVIMVLALDHHRRILLERRNTAGIWGGLWSLPEYAGDIAGLPSWFAQRYTMQTSVEYIMKQFQHHFTHYRLDITPVVTRVEVTLHRDLLHLGIDFVSLDEPLDRGVPTPVTKLIERIRSSNLYTSIGQTGLSLDFTGNEMVDERV